MDYSERFFSRGWQPASKDLGVGCRLNPRVYPVAEMVTNCARMKQVETLCNGQNGVKVVPTICEAMTCAFSAVAAIKNDVTPCLLVLNRTRVPSGAVMPLLMPEAEMKWDVTICNGAETPELRDSPSKTHFVAETQTMN